MARDRKRAKQRQRRSGAGAGTTSASTPVRADLPGSLDHASGDVDEFDAAIIRGARGEIPAAETAPNPFGTPEGEGEIGLGEDPGAPLADDTGNGGRRRGSGGRGGDDGDSGDGAQLPERRPEARPPLPGRAVAFLRASWAELQRVQWPDRRQVTQATAVVLGFVAVAGAYLGLADYVAKQIVEAIL